MINHDQEMKLRAKKLGVSLFDVRIASQKSISEIAGILGISSKLYREFESGEKSPSLPEIEILSYFLKIPLRHFIESDCISYKNELEDDISFTKLRNIRDRVIGTRLHLARTQSGVSVNDISKKLLIPVSKIKQYELGVKSIPLPELEAYAKEIDMDLEEFYDIHGPIGKWLIREDHINNFNSLPEELQAFISNSEKRPYLELALRLSEFSTEKLRQVAENILEITLDR